MSKRKVPTADSERWEKHFRTRFDPRGGDEEMLQIIDSEEEQEQSKEVQQPAKRSKTRSDKPDDDNATKLAIAYTNERAEKHQRDKTVFDSKSLDSIMTVGRVGPGQRMEFHSNFGRMSELREQYAKNTADPETKPEARAPRKIPDGKVEITGETFKAKSVESLLDSLFAKNQEFHNMKSGLAKDGVVGYVKPVDPPWHIQKLLVQARAPFNQCLNASLGRICQAQKEPRLRHPISPNVPCQAYCTQAEYQEIHDVLKYPGKIPGNVRKDYCEFCYRFVVHKQVLNAMNNNHKVQEEIASRFHQTDVKGSYTKEGMHQPVVMTNTAYPDGILGTVRMYSVADFIPVMILFQGEDIKEIVGIEEYKKKNPEQQKLYLAGWQEIKHIQNLNCNALPTVPQISPYVIGVPGNLDNLSVASILQTFCRQRKLECRLPVPHNLAFNVFLDLKECLSDPGYLDCIKLDKFDYWCPHREQGPPLPIKNHSIYYTLLLKVNALREWTRDGSGDYGLSGYMKQKMRSYLLHHKPLIEFFEKHHLFTDDAMLQPIFAAPATGNPTAALFAHYPHAKQHFRSSDYQFSIPTVTLRRRPNPLDVCREYYSEPIRSLGKIRFPPQADLDERYSFYQQLGNLLDTLPSYKALFQGNIDRLEYFGASVELKWKNPEPLHQNWENTFDEDQVAKAFATIFSQVVENFERQKQYLSVKQKRYKELLKKYASIVFQDFDETLQYLEALPLDQFLAIVSEFSSFIDCFPEGAPKRIKITETGLNGVGWEAHKILVACFLRVAVMEELHELEPTRNTEIRYQLRLFSGCHVKLVSKILSCPEKLETDADLEFRDKNAAGATTRRGAIQDMFYPYPEREVHEGCLPDKVNCLTKVDFYANTGMSDKAFNKILYKLPDRACDTRELSEVLIQHCKKDVVFYNYICLLLEVSLKGNYRHCTIATKFSRKIVLEELFSNADTMQIAIQQLILDNQSMIADALAEALCYMLEFSPALKEMLLELYKNWFDWRVKLNMDLIRHFFNLYGNFNEGRVVVYKRIDLKTTSRDIFRQRELDFVGWLAKLIKKANEERYKIVAKAVKTATAADLELEMERKIDDDTRVLVRLFVRALPENAVIEVKDLQIIGLTMDTLEKLNELYDCFLAQISSTKGGTEARNNLSEKILFRVLGEIEKPQYAILCHFIQILQNYHSIFSMQIDNLEILQQQEQHLKTITESLGLEEVPDDLTRFCFTPFCCASIKTSLPTRVDAEAYGHEKIAYNIMNQLYVCGKHNFQASKSKSADAADKGDERIKAKIQRQVERDDQKPKCSDTEVCFFSARGAVIQTDGCKVPRSKKNLKQKDAKEDIKKLPAAAWWITPCCGKRYSYDFWNWWNGMTYCCGTCQRGNDIAASFRVIFCDNCYCQTTDYTVSSVYDDDETQSFRTMVICNKCVYPWRQGIPYRPLKSQLRNVVMDKDYLPWLVGCDVNLI